VFFYIFSFGSNLLQKYINSNSIIKFRKYYDQVRKNLTDTEDIILLDALLKLLETKKAFVDDSRPVELLHHVSKVTNETLLSLFIVCLIFFKQSVRLLCGLRITNCKSGKDRTGVGVSLEQVLILLQNHDLNKYSTQYFLDDLRRY